MLILSPERHVAALRQPSSASRRRRSLVVVAALVPALALAADPPIKLNGPLVPGGKLSSSRFSPDGSRVVYLADQDADEVDELFSVAPEVPPLHFASGFEALQVLQRGLPRRRGGPGTVN